MKWGEIMCIFNGIYYFYSYKVIKGFTVVTMMSSLLKESFLHKWTLLQSFRKGSRVHCNRLDCKWSSPYVETCCLFLQTLVDLLYVLTLLLFTFPFLFLLFCPVTIATHLIIDNEWGYSDWVFYWSGFS